MSRYIIEIEDKDGARFEALLAQHGFAPAADPTTYQVPEWQKDHVRRVLAETPPDKYVSLAEARLQWDKENQAEQ